MAPQLQFSSRQIAQGKHTFDWVTDKERLLTISNPIVLESALGPVPSSVDGDRKDIFYENIESTPSHTRASASFVDTNGITGSITDTWSTRFLTTFTVSRSVNINSAIPNAALRVGLHLQPALPEGVGFNDLEYYAPNACYNLNDLNEDGVCDYLDAQTLSYREDRLNALSVLAYHAKRQLAFSISRADVPKYDSSPVREKGQLAFLQDTDIGALGFSPNGGDLHDAILTASYPFVERERCNALLVQERVPWGAFRPVKAGDSFTISYTIRVYHASSAHDALWHLLKEQFTALQPSPVSLDLSLDEIARQRLDALSKYYMEDSVGGAGFVTNCHPQDGKQLGNVIQYGAFA
jgi:hypothetical protein